MDQPDLFEAKKARDEGIAQVLRGSWVSRLVLAISKLPIGWLGTGEAIRLAVIKNGLEEPHHHNAWGAGIMSAEKRGLIKKTGKLEHMRTKKSHARLTPVYIRTVAEP